MKSKEVALEVSTFTIICFGTQMLLRSFKMEENNFIVLPNAENYKEVVSCRNRYYNKSNIIGVRFESKNYGIFEVIDYNGGLCTVKFINTGYETTSKKHNIIIGAVKDKLAPSVHGVGITGMLPSRIDGVLVPQYQLWSSILQRCYCPKYHKTQPSYIGCTVSENFKKYEFFHNWCNDQIGFGKEGWQLDKDLLGGESHSYHEDHCVFIPQDINVILHSNSKSRGSFALGVSIERSGGFRATVNNWGESKFLGCFDTEAEAFLAYKEAKEMYVREVAEFYKSQIDLRVYEFLVNYRIGDI
jgi:hypothetical protein